VIRRRGTLGWVLPNNGPGFATKTKPKKKQKTGGIKRRRRLERRSITFTVGDKQSPNAPPVGAGKSRKPAGPPAHGSYEPGVHVAREKEREKERKNPLAGGDGPRGILSQKQGLVVPKNGREKFFIRKKKKRGGRMVTTAD